jgi:hypothetical protein
MQCFLHLKITNPTFGFVMSMLGPTTSTLDFTNYALNLIISTLDLCLTNHIYQIHITLDVLIYKVVT